MADSSELSDFSHTPHSHPNSHPEGLNLTHSLKDMPSSKSG